MAKRVRHRVRVEIVEVRTVEVVTDADQEPAAVLATAERETGYQDPFSRGKRVRALEVVKSGPADRPLVDLPTNYQLYSSMPGAAEANRTIQAAVSEVAEAMVARARAGKDVGPKFVAGEFRAKVAPLFEKYAELGAEDSEPAAVVADFLGRWAKGLGGRQDDIYEAVRWA